MRKTFVLFALALTALACGAAMGQAPGEPGIRPPSITVTGAGEVQAKPDFAQVQVGVVTEGATAAEAMRKNNEAMSQLIAMIRKRGIEDRDLQTIQFNVSPRYSMTRISGSPRK